jgi:hypothetical protein
MTRPFPRSRLPPALPAFDRNKPISIDVQGSECRPRPTHQSARPLRLTSIIKQRIDTPQCTACCGGIDLDLAPRHRVKPARRQTRRAAYRNRGDNRRAGFAPVTSANEVEVDAALWQKPQRIGSCRCAV